MVHSQHSHLLHCLYTICNSIQNLQSPHFQNLWKNCFRRLPEERQTFHMYKWSHNFYSLSYPEKEGQSLLQMSPLLYNFLQKPPHGKHKYPHHLYWRMYRSFLCFQPPALSRYRYGTTDISVLPMFRPSPPQSAYTIYHHYN